MRGPARIATYLGRILMVVGFLLIVVAWNGAASLDFIQGQFPYLLSGSMPGLGLIIVGAGLEYVQTARQLTAKRAKQMAELNLAVVRLIGFVRETGSLPTVETARAQQPTPVGVGAGTARAAAGAPANASGDRSGDIVVAGRSSFHDPSCHLVSGRDDMAVITRLEAEGQGLSACRVCKP